MKSEKLCTFHYVYLLLARYMPTDTNNTNKQKYLLCSKSFSYLLYSASCILQSAEYHPSILWLLLFMLLLFVHHRREGNQPVRDAVCLVAIHRTLSFSMSHLKCSYIHTSAVSFRLVNSTYNLRRSWSFTFPVISAPGHHNFFCNVLCTPHKIY